MKRIFLILLLPLAGCQVFDTQLGLVDQSHKGVQLVRESVEKRKTIDTARNAAERKRLDEAFDDDVASRMGPMPAEWVLDARKAYAAAIDAMHGRDEAAAAAADADLQNLTAVDDALTELGRLVRVQQRFFFIPEKP